MAQFKQGDLREAALARYIIDEDGNILGGATTKAEVQIPQWVYVGGSAYTFDGANDQQLAIPAGATIFELRAESGEVYFEVNGVSASASSPGYIPQDGAEIVGPLSNLVRLWVFSSTASAVVHYMWFREA